MILNQMEVDLHSPSFRAMRSTTSGFSSKRPRSPESGVASPFDRPTKRLSLAIHEHYHTNTNSVPSPAYGSASSSRFPSEDFVRQADGLSIDSPVVPGMVREAGMQDDDMIMDADETVQQRPELPRIETTSQMSFAQALYTQHHQQDTPLLSSGGGQQQRHPLSAVTPAGPTVTVLPPTPAPAFPMVSYSTSRPSTPVSDNTNNNTMMMSSPTASVVGVTSPRRQRFTMGPRSDCVKCQLGVKGHSVHY